MVLLFVVELCNYIFDGPCSYIVYIFVSNN